MIYTKVTIPTAEKHTEHKMPAYRKNASEKKDRDSSAKTFVFAADSVRNAYRTQKTVSDKTDACAKTAEIPDFPAHKPEIVLTEHTDENAASSESPSNAEVYVHASCEHTLFERFLPFSGKLALLAILCMVSFLFGCTVTDRKLCRVVMAVSAAASGRIPDTPISDVYGSVAQAAKAQQAADSGETFYRKYSTDGSFSDSSAETPDSLDYLAAHENPVSDASDGTSALPDTSVIPVQSAETGKIGSDSEVLYPVMSSDFRAKDLFSLSNETRYTPDVDALLKITPSALQNLSLDGNPLVLIVHTHGTEAYNECEKDGYYDAAQPVRSEDISQNVVSVGTALAGVLNDFGIVTLHDTTMCDKDSFVRAYKTSAALVKSYLEQYPSIRFVIDLHRDSISSPDGSASAPVFSYAGEEAAQLMLVVGTNAAGANHPNWSDNLSLALQLQKKLSDDYPGMFRRINLRMASFNEQLSSGYLLLECGAFANSRVQAERAAKLFGTGLARLITEAAKSA